MPATRHGQDRWLDLNDLLRDLVAQGLLSQPDA